MQEINDLFKIAYPKNIPVLFGGSGTAVMESAISSVIDNQRASKLINGAYGYRRKQKKKYSIYQSLVYIQL